MKRVPLIAWLGLALAGSVWLAAGCYTLLQHPQSADLIDEEGLQRTCADCHADSDLYHPGWAQTWYRAYPAPWAAYYDTPWWYDDWWYYPPSHPYPPEPGGPAESGQRHLWSQSPGSGVLPSQGEPQGPGLEPGRTTPPADGSGTKDDKDTKEEKKEEKKEKRRLWGR